MDRNSDGKIDSSTIKADTEIDTTLFVSAERQKAIARLALGEGIEVIECALRVVISDTVRAIGLSARDSEPSDVVGYLKPQVEGASEPWFIRAADRTQDWQKTVFTVPVRAVDPTEDRRNNDE